MKDTLGLQILGIYKIPCGRGKRYIGQTGHTTEVIYTDHKGGLQLGNMIKIRDGQEGAEMTWKRVDFAHHPLFPILIDLISGFSSPKSGLRAGGGTTRNRQVPRPCGRGGERFTEPTIPHTPLPRHL